MSRPAGVTAQELVDALKRRRAALPAEIGSFVVLEACEALLVRGPELLALDGIHISEEGSVWLPPGTRCAEADAALALHRLLTTMLVAAGPAPPPALMHLLEKGPSGGSWTLAGLRDDLEASLVPLNRGASRRVLARFVRETGWAQRPDVSPTFGELDSELSSLLGVEQPRPAIPSLRERLRDAEILQSEPPPGPQEELDDVRFFESVRPPFKQTAGKTIVDEAPPGDLRAARDVPKERHPSMRPAPSNAPSRRPGDSTFDFGLARKSRALWAGVALVVLSVLVLVLTFKLRPGLETRLVKPSADEKQAGDARPKVVVKRPPGADLAVRVATERAQILRLVGRGPVSVPHLPLGVAHEFVAIAEGLTAARLLIPANAEWEATPDGRRFEAAMQLDKPTLEGDTLELGETLLPQDVGSPSATLGSVRIVTTPRGAKVYQVIGFAPEALVEQLPAEASQEILVFRKGFAPEVRVIGPSDYVDTPEGAGHKRAELEVTLSPLGRK
jgi:hypothetical protein